MNGYRAAKYDQEVEAAFEQATTVDIGVAFVTKSGIYFGQIQRKLNEFLARDGRLRLLLDLQLGNTDPTVLEEMLALQNSGLNVECRAYVSHADGVFHPKVYIFHKSDGTITVVTGSANWTGPAYSTNVEYGVVFEGAADTSTIKDAVQFFNEHWNSASAKVIDGEAARLYRSYWRRRQGLERKARNRAASAWRHLAQHFDEVVATAHEGGLLSDEHFTVVGTLIKAAASLKSFKPKEGDPPPTDGDPGNPSVDFHGEKRRNATHRSTTDPEARLLRKGKGKEAKLVFMAHALMENRHGLLVDFQVTEATGTVEREMAPMLVEEAKERHFRPKTLGGDKPVSLLDLVDTLVWVAGSGSYRVVPFPEDRKRIDIGDFYADYTKIKQTLGWQPTIGLEEGLRRTVEYYKQYRKHYWTRE